MVISKYGFFEIDTCFWGRYDFFIILSKIQVRCSGNGILLMKVFVHILESLYVKHILIIFLKPIIKRKTK
jgi:hypothetical protein